MRTLRRLAVAACAATLLFTATVVAAQAPATHRIVDANGDTFDVAAPFTVDTIPAPATTTTTTTAGPEEPLAIPPTQPYPDRAFKDDGSFQFMISCGDTSEFTCPLNAAGKAEIAEVSYIGHGMPYLYPGAAEGSHDHAWWVAGDREGYRCAYGFMYDQHPNPFDQLSEPRPGHFIARATIVRPFGAAYGRINDKFMAEGVRYYDGTVVDPQLGSEIVDEDCQAAALDDFDYGSYVPHGPDAIRVGLWRADGEISDIRDFNAIDVQVPGHFEFVGWDGQRVTIVFVLAGAGVSHVFYYDVMNDGRISVEVNGALVAAVP